MPDFRSPAFLLDHIRHTLAFYDGRDIDPSGGFFHYFRDDGQVFDTRSRHLVSSTRFVFNHAMALRQFGASERPNDLEAVRHGLRFLQQAHAQAQGGYAWMIDWDGQRASVEDGTQHCYGLAFVLLAHAHALMAGASEARAGLDATFALMEQRFWEPAHGLYADDASPDWQVSSYRGQNANMHGCEAMLAAHEATGDEAFLARAVTLAEHIAQRQAALAGGLVWEHYRSDWSVDWDYNRHDNANIFRPWGYQIGHLTEWTKLLLQLEARLPEAQRPTWLLPTARHFFDRHAAWLGRDARRLGLRQRPRWPGVRWREVLLGAGRKLRRRGLDGGAHGRAGVLGLVRPHLDIQLGPHDRPPARRLVLQARQRQPCAIRPQESRRQDRLPHDGCVLRRVARAGVALTRVRPTPARRGVARAR